MFNKIFKNYIFNIFLVLFFTIAILFITLNGSFDEVIATLKNINIKWFLIAILVLFLKLVITSIALVNLTKISNPNFKLFDGLINVLVASFFHGITPGASGGQFAQIYVFKKQGVDLSDSASILWMEFIIYQVAMIITVSILLVLKYTYFKQYFNDLYHFILLGFLVNSSIIIGLYLLGKSEKVYKFIITKGLDIVFKLKLIKDKEKTINTLDNQIEKFKVVSTKLQNHKPLLIKVLLLNFLRLLVFYSIPFFCVKALNIPVDNSVLIDIIALNSYVTMINAFIPSPGSSGGSEAVFIFLFSALFGTVNAGSIMILWRFTTYYLVLIIGGLTFICTKYMYKKEVLQ